MSALTSNETASLLVKMIDHHIPSLSPNELMHLLDVQKYIRDLDFLNSLSPSQLTLMRAYLAALDVIIAIGGLHVEAVLTTLTVAVNRAREEAQP